MIFGQIQIAGDGGQGVIEIMRNAGNQRADSFHFLRLIELGQQRFVIAHIFQAGQMALNITLPIQNR